MRYKAIVQRNRGKGRELGFPTANLTIAAGLADGIYAAWVFIKNKKLASLVFIGQAETFNDPARRFEVHILDFADDLYGRELEVEVLKKMRDNRKFDSEAELIRQMEQDEKDAREYFQNAR